MSISPPDVLQPGTTTDCVNCPRWQSKYLKAKQTLAATLEKLQAANVRKEKVDRALSKELGKTHNILCQVIFMLTENVIKSNIKNPFHYLGTRPFGTGQSNEPERKSTVIYRRAFFLFDKRTCLNFFHVIVLSIPSKGKNAVAKSVP